MTGPESEEIEKAIITIHVRPRLQPLDSIFTRSCVVKRATYCRKSRSVSPFCLAFVYPSLHGRPPPPILQARLLAEAEKNKARHG